MTTWNNFQTAIINLKPIDIKEDANETQTGIII